MPQEGQRVRFQIDVTPDFDQLVSSLEKRTGLPTRSETVRKSIVLLDLLSKEIAKGGKVVVRAKDGTEQVMLIVL